MRNEHPTTALSDEELALEQAVELPEREALSVINLVPLPVLPASATPVPAAAVEETSPAS